MMMREKGAREIALEVLYQVEQADAYANVQLNHMLEKYNPSAKERALTTNLVYGVLRRRNTLDWMIEQFSNRSVQKMTVWIRNILRLGTYQLLYLDKIPVSAVCNEATKLAKKKGHLGVSKFVNGILRTMVRNLEHLPWPERTDLAAYLAVRYSHPHWLVQRWLTQFGSEKTEQICQADNETPLFMIRTNMLKTTPEELKQRLTTEGVTASLGSLVKEALYIQESGSLTRLTSYQEGLFQVQDESSMLVAAVLDPQPGERILDACSAPGGKTTHIAEKMQNRGKIIANELKKSKLSLVEDACRRLGVTIVQVRNDDARILGDCYREQMDRVLLDVPCSGLGVLRRKPDARWRKTEEQIAELVLLQQEILDRCAACVKPGGVLVYSTCTLESAENEGQIQRFLAEHQEFVLGDIRAYLPAALREMVPEKTGFIQLYPGETDGFFICRLERKKAWKKS